jgi:GMP synthase (glutamine-hydrolysing)
MPKSERKPSSSSTPLTMTMHARTDRAPGAPQKVLVVLHQEQSTPARIGRILQQMGYVLDVRRPRFGDPLPEHMHDHAGAVIFGGPMSANDSDEFIRKEIDWVGVALRDEAPLLGVCLGGQMIARHLGERVYTHDAEHVEIGYYPIRATDHGRQLCDAPFPEHVYQWHREGFDLPSDATLLAEGDVFPVQAFGYGSATAIQFHPEVTLENIYRWTTRAGERMHGVGAQPRGHHVEGWYQHDAPVAQWIRAYLATWARK